MERLTADDLLKISSALGTELFKIAEELHETKEHKKTDKPIYLQTSLWNDGSYLEKTGEKRDRILDQQICDYEKEYNEVLNLNKKVLDIIAEMIGYED